VNALDRCCYEFGSFRLDPAEQNLLHDGKVVPLTPKSFDTLLILIENHGHLVEKDELLERVWADTYVEEANIAKHIHILRKVLSGNGLKEPIIETVPTRGYRFVAPLTEIEVEAPQEIPPEVKTPPDIEDPDGSRLPRTSIRRKGITAPILSFGIIAVVAVLAVGGWNYFTRNPDNSSLVADDTVIDSIAIMPFVNASGNKDVEYLSDGMTETLISSLSKISSLSVKARSSVFRYKGKEVSPKKIGEELNVRAVLLGRLVQRGDDLRLSLELVDAQSENVLWSENYDRKMSNLVSLQNEIARNVSDKIKSKLSGEDEKKLTKTYTANPDAYKAYLKGRFHWNKRTKSGIKKGIEFFKQAIEIDPNYALAWSGLADSYIVLPSNQTNTAPKEAYPKARPAAEKAIALDPDLAEAHTSLAQIMHEYDWDFTGAEKELQTAIRLNPKSATAHQWYGEFLSNMGRHDDAIREGKIAAELEPLSLIINSGLVVRFFFARRYDEAKVQIQRNAETFPDYASFRLAVILNRQGKFKEALAACNKRKELGHGDYINCFGYVYATSGKKREAYRVRDHRTNHGGFANNDYVWAVMHAMLDEKDKAFPHLEKVIQMRGGGILRLTTEAGFDNLRDDPRYKEMVKRIGLPE